MGQVHKGRFSSCGTQGSCCALDGSAEAALIAPLESLEVAKHAAEADFCAGFCLAEGRSAGDAACGGESGLAVDGKGAKRCPSYASRCGSRSCCISRPSWSWRRRALLLPPMLTRCTLLASLLAFLVLAARRAWLGGSFFSLDTAPRWPLLEGIVPQDEFFLQHIGGFCFGRRTAFDKDPTVGRLTVRISSVDGQNDWQWRRLLVLIFDDVPSHFPAAWSMWNYSHVLDIVVRSNSCHDIIMLGSAAPPSMYAQAAKIAAVQDGAVELHFSISERFKRKWNIAIAGFGSDSNVSNPPAGPLRYQVVGQQALNVWDSRVPDFLSRNCPGQPMQFLKEELWDYMVTPTPAPTPAPRPPQPPAAHQHHHPAQHRTSHSLCSRSFYKNS
eukprot:TRINITY_DN37929_c0_g1_i1.p1 TRINITY_DN37929_c0_g1~~TRINITY_DN37929_c0_g1_i1.p1  ORF type:complete len:385 (-),score=69.94 TRINITY_DN37929_c0_g1_i1:163-1317(-)